MFQDFALFPHMNVYANVAFGLKMAHIEPNQMKQRVGEMLTLVGLPGFSKRDVNTLSGGEQQRIALARALAPHPHMLMLDEPLGSLDRILRERLVGEIQTILKQMQQTAIYVTHDQEEAFTIADRIILLNSGKIEQIGTPRDIFTNPASLFVASFLNMANFIEGEAHKQDGGNLIKTTLGNFSTGSPKIGRVMIMIRPDQACLDASGPVILSGLFKDISFRGSVQRITLVVNKFPLIFEFPSNISLPNIGSQMTFSIDPAKAIKVFPLS
jgi:ABC-type Fe3+/spermidine/putrescine transport system ATPase subunit